MRRLRQLDIPRAMRNFADLIPRQAARNGAKVFLRFEDETYTYAEVERITARLCNGLIALGIGHGGHVAIMMSNCPENIWVQFALARIGAVSTPINTAVKGDLLTYYLNHSDSVALVIGAEWLERYAEVRAASPQVAQVIVVPDGACAPTADFPTIPYAQLDAAPQTGPGIRVDPDDCMGLYYTSGTTGPSKGVVSSQASKLHFSIGRAEYIGYQADDTLYTCLPLFHGNAMMATCIPAFLADATLALGRRFSARAFWGDIRKFGVTKFNLLSSMTNILWVQPEGPEDADHLPCDCNTVPIPPFAREFEARFNVRMTSAYSLTDFGLGTVYQWTDPPQKLGSAGKARPGVHLAMLDDDDRPAPTGEIGEICLRDDEPLTPREYYKAPEATAEANKGGWFHTGDRGYLDADGFMFFADRKKDSIRRRGENVSTWEVEQVISGHSAVAEVAVYPVKSGMSEDEVMAAIVLRQGRTATPEEVIRFCEKNMAYYMVPRFVEFLEVLPKTATEKVRKNELRAASEARLDQLWDREKAGIELKR